MICLYRTYIYKFYVLHSYLFLLLHVLYLTDSGRRRSLFLTLCLYTYVCLYVYNNHTRQWTTIHTAKQKFPPAPRANELLILAAAAAPLPYKTDCRWRIHSVIFCPHHTYDTENPLSNLQIFCALEFKF